MIFCLIWTQVFLTQVFLTQVSERNEDANADWCFLCLLLITSFDFLFQVFRILALGQELIPINSLPVWSNVRKGSVHVIGAIYILSSNSVLCNSLMTGQMYVTIVACSASLADFCLSNCIT